MTHDWLLVETLGTEPAVVAQGQTTKDLVPISGFLRRDPNLMAIQTAIGESVRAGHALSSITPKHGRVIRTEVVLMTDGRVHGVHVWVGPPDLDPPERPVPGPLKWDLTHGVATDTPESLLNSGRDPSIEATQGRAFAEDLPSRALSPSEAKVLSAAVKPKPGVSFCSTWEIADHEGRPITVGFVGRVLLESGNDGRENLICRAMNWRSVRDESTYTPIDLGQRLLDGQAQPGVHRALVDLRTWTLLKWLDDPCPFYDWRAGEGGAPAVHPDDEAAMASMTPEFERGATSRLLRLPAVDGDGWIPVHVSAHRVELDEGVFAGLLSLRLPTEEEVAAAEAAAPKRKARTRKSRPRKDKSADTAPPG